VSRPNNTDSRQSGITFSRSWLALTFSQSFKERQMSDKPEILTDVYGKSAPDAAKFGVGAMSLADIKEATEAHREAINKTYSGGEKQR
jgi:hypothetical protein